MPVSIQAVGMEPRYHLSDLGHRWILNSAYTMVWPVEFPLCSVDTLYYAVG